LSENPYAPPQQVKIKQEQVHLYVFYYIFYINKIQSNLFIDYRTYICYHKYGAAKTVAACPLTLLNLIISMRFGGVAKGK
jgi:hypothetical protein